MRVVARPAKVWEPGHAKWKAPAPVAEEDMHDGEDGQWGGECSDSDFEEPPPTPADEFVNFMVGFLMRRTLNAKQFCIAMYWASKAGIPLAERYGFPPNKCSGHYQRHLDTVMEDRKEMENLYCISVPGHNKADLSRTAHTVPVIPPHECLAAHMDRADFKVALREKIAAGDLPAAYKTHPLVAPRADAGGGPVVLQRPPPHPCSLVAPISLYMDAVPYSQTDSVLGVWAE